MKAITINPWRRFHETCIRDSAVQQSPGLKKPGGRRSASDVGPKTTQSPVKPNTRYSLLDHFRYVRSAQATPGTPLLINEKKQYYYIYKGEHEVNY